MNLRRHTFPAVLATLAAAPAAAQGLAPTIVTDSAGDTIWACTDANADGDYNDAGELTIFYDDATGSITLTNNAGILRDRMLFSMSEDDWDAVIAVHLKGTFAPSNHAAKYWREKAKAGEDVYGRIINTASPSGIYGNVGQTNYGASKAGIAQLTRAMAEAWSRFGINTNAIGPGFFPTELTGPVFADAERSARNAAQTCIGRNGDLSDIDGPLLFLCSQASTYVTGQVLMVDGGYTAK